MNGIIIYNGSADIEKIDKLVHKLKNKGKSLGINLELIRNNEIFMYHHRDGKRDIKPYFDPDKIDFVIFWDKDVLLARHLESMGFNVFNTSKSIGLCDNKTLMHQHLMNKNIPMPKTILGPMAYYKQRVNKDYYEFVVQELGHQFILKEAIGSFGAGVHMVADYDHFASLIQSLGNKPFLIQENIKNSKGRDLRLNFIGNTMVGGMERRNDKDFRANITLGGRGCMVEASQAQIDLALKAHQALGLHFSGVDLLFDENEEPLLCEVNSNVNYVSYEELSDFDFSKALLEYIGNICR